MEISLVFFGLMVFLIMHLLCLLQKARKKFRKLKTVQPEDVPEETYCILTRYIMNINILMTVFLLVNATDQALKFISLEGYSKVYMD